MKIKIKLKDIVKDDDLPNKLDINPWAIVNGLCTGEEYIEVKVHKGIRQIILENIIKKI